jgi:hypothetical protein
MRLVVLLGLAACSTPVAPHTSQLAPPQFGDLSELAFVPGESTRLTVAADPGSEVCLYASLSSGGPLACPPALQDGCLDLSRPAVQIARQTAGVDGLAQIDVTPPPLSPGLVMLQPVDCATGETGDVYELRILSPNGDEDGDGAPNGIEVRFGSSPLNPDTDGDGLDDPDEVLTHGSNPLLADSDGGSTPDGDEIRGGLDPNDPSDDCTFVPDPALAVGEAGLTLGMTAAVNELRWRVGVPRLRWDRGLAAQAAVQARVMAASCQLQFSGTPGVGETIYMQSSFGSTTGVDAVAAWACGQSYHDPTQAASTCTGQSPAVAPIVPGCPGNAFDSCGSYTQQVWERTDRMGCATFSSSTCGFLNEDYWVCQYAPAGNVFGDQAYPERLGQCLDQDHDGEPQSTDVDDQDASL